MRSLCYPIDHKGTQTDKILNACNNTISMQETCTLLNTSNDWCVSVSPPSCRFFPFYFLFYPMFFIFILYFFIIVTNMFFFSLFLPVILKGKKKWEKTPLVLGGRDGDRFGFKESGSVWWSFYFDSDSNHRLTDQPEIFVSPSSTTPRTQKFQHGFALNCIICNISVRPIPYRWSSLILDTFSQLQF
jgi:hypothetical protein